MRPGGLVAPGGRAGGHIALKQLCEENEERSPSISEAQH